MNKFDQERTVTLTVTLSYDEVEAPRVTAKGGTTSRSKSWTLPIAIMSRYRKIVNWCNFCQKLN